MSILGNVGSGVNPSDDDDYLVSDDLFSTEYPGLFEFLARIRIDGKPRRPGRVVLYYDSGKANLCLSDKHTGSCSFHADEGIQEALEGVEKRLQEGKMDWRKDKRARGYT